METHEVKYKKLYRFTARIERKSFVGSLFKFVENSNNISSLKLNINVKKEILKLEVFCNSQNDFEKVYNDIFNFFHLGEIKKFFIRYYDLENGRYVFDWDNSFIKKTCQSKSNVEVAP